MCVVGFQLFKIQELEKDEDHAREAKCDAKDHKFDSKILRSNAQYETCRYRNETKCWHHQRKKDWRKTVEEGES